MEQIENVSEYHSVFANSIISSMNAVVGKDEIAAKKLMRFMINYAYTQFRESKDSEIEYGTIKKELDELKLSDKSIEELTILMSYYQSKANMKPVQLQDNSARIYRNVRGRL